MAKLFREKIEKYDLKSEPSIPFVLEPHWNKKITVPPFNPNRVEARFDLVYEGREKSPFYQPLHTWQWTTENRNNFISDKTNNGLCIWLSTRSLQNQRGSLMVYSIKNGEVESWYASIENHNGWKITRTKGIDKEKLLFMIGDQYLWGIKADTFFDKMH